MDRKRREESAIKDRIKEKQNEKSEGMERAVLTRLHLSASALKYIALLAMTAGIFRTLDGCTAPECLPDLFSGAGCDGAVRAVWKRYLGEAGADGSVLYADRSGGSRRRRMGDGTGAGILFLCNRKFRH